MAGLGRKQCLRNLAVSLEGLRTFTQSETIHDGCQLFVGKGDFCEACRHHYAFHAEAKVPRCETWQRESNVSEVLTKALSPLVVQQQEILEHLTGISSQGEVVGDLKYLEDWQIEDFPVLDMDKYYLIDPREPASEQHQDTQQIIKLASPPKHCKLTAAFKRPASWHGVRLLEYRSQFNEVALVFNLAWNTYPNRLTVDALKFRPISYDIADAESRRVLSIIMVDSDDYLQYQSTVIEGKKVGSLSILSRHIFRRMTS